eukprot:gene2372-20432_t
MRVPRVASIASHLRVLKEKIEEQAKGHFREVRFGDIDAEKDEEKLKLLAAACRVVDVIGDQCRRGEDA